MVPGLANQVLGRPKAAFWIGKINRIAGQFRRSGAIFVPIFLFMLVLCGQVHATPITHDNETISSNQEWDNVNTHHIKGNCTVNAGVTLTIQQGAVVKFDSGASLTVNGTLNAEGTSSAGDHIYFTSINDDSVGGTISGSMGMPGAGDWDYILFDGYSGNEGVGTFSYCTIRYGDGNSSYQAGLYASNGSALTLTDCEITQSATSGMYASSSSASITACNIKNNNNYGLHFYGTAATQEVYASLISNNNDGIYCENGANPVIGGAAANSNTISGNTNYGVYNASSSVTVNATYNYWGDDSGPSGEGPASGDRVSLYVDYSNWVQAEDTDSDGLDDAWEMQYFGNLDQGPEDDPDEDGLTNAQEYAQGTNPILADTDGDGLQDGDEVTTYGTNPLMADSDEDGYYDGEEVRMNSDPNNSGDFPAYDPGTYYVNISSGNDLIGEGSAGNAWKTLHHAVHRTNEGNPGAYTINVGLGTYRVGNGEPDEKLIITQNNVTVLGESGSKPILDGTGAGSDEDTDWGIGIETSGNEIIIENIEVCNFSYWEGILIEGNNTTIVDCNVHDNAVGIAFDDVEHNVGGNVKTCNVHDNAAEGISVVDAQDVLIEECEVYGNGASGYDSGIYLKHADVSINLNTIHANSSCGIAVEDCSPEIEKNDIHDNGWCGIDIWSYTQEASPVIKNNLIYFHSGGTGIVMRAFPGSTNPKIYHNTIDGGSGDGIYCYGSQAAPEIKYNIITNFDQYGINNSDGNPSIDYNDV